MGLLLNSLCSELRRCSHRPSNYLSTELIVSKYNPFTNIYFNLTGTYGATLEEVTIDGHTVTVASYQITDGGDLDMDDEPGQIADPAGLASQVVSTPNTGFVGKR